MPLQYLSLSLDSIHNWLLDTELPDQQLVLPLLLLLLLLYWLVGSRREVYVSQQQTVTHQRQDRPKVANRLDGVKCDKPNAEIFTTLSEVRIALRRAGLETASVVFAIDFTASNRFQGSSTFGGKCLHDISSSGSTNPYQSVICSLGETLEAFPPDGHFYAFGFGDSRYSGSGVFPLGQEETCCGFQGVYRAYCQRAVSVRLGGKTNFAPVINRVEQLCRESRAYHILVIVADGQVVCERETVEEIERASFWPMSIVVIGVGDGPWKMMEEFDRGLPRRKFDNFHFVNFHEAVNKSKHSPEVALAVAALMEIPDQFVSVRRLGLLDFDSD